MLVDLRLSSLSRYRPNYCCRIAFDEGRNLSRCSKRTGSSNREGGNRVLVRRWRTRLRRQIFISPVCAVIEKLMQMEGVAPKVVDMLLIVGRGQNGRDLGENVRLGSAKIVVL